jgi:hypothetical protein
MLSNFTYFFTAHPSLPAIATVVGAIVGIVTCFFLMDREAPVGATIGGSLVTTAVAAALWPCVVFIAGTALVGYVFFTSLHYFIIDPFVDYLTRRRAWKNARIIVEQGKPPRMRVVK